MPQASKLIASWADSMSHLVKPWEDVFLHIVAEGEWLLQERGAMEANAAFHCLAVLFHILDFLSVFFIGTNGPFLNTSPLCVALLGIFQPARGLCVGACMRAWVPHPRSALFWELTSQ